MDDGKTTVRCDECGGEMRASRAWVWLRCPHCGAKISRVEKDEEWEREREVYRE